MPRPTGVCVGSVVGVWSVCGSRWDSVCWRTISWLSGPPASEKPPMDKMERLARTQLKSGTILVRRREGGTSRRHLDLMTRRRVEPDQATRTSQITCRVSRLPGMEGWGAQRAIVAINQSPNGSRGSAKMAQFLVAADIPVESEEDRVVRPPRQTCHRKGSGADRWKRNHQHNWQQLGDKSQNRAGARRTSVGRVYREVSFNYFVNQR